jgi:hypothetical protein
MLRKTADLPQKILIKRLLVLYLLMTLRDDVALINIVWGPESHDSSSCGSMVDR